MKKNQKIADVIRIVLSLALIFGVYTETGIWTSIFAFLVSLYIECKNREKG